MRFDDIMRYVPVNEDWENTMELSKSAKRGLMRVQKAVDKFNQLRAEAVELMGSEDGLYYDNSSTVESSPQYISELKGPYVEDGGVVIRYESDEFDGRRTTRQSEEIYERLYDDGEGGLDFNDDDMVFSINYIRRGVNRAMRYFREYNPSDENEDGENLKWEQQEAASDVEERFTMKKNNKHIVNEEFDGEFDGPRMDLVKDMKRTVLAKAMEYDGQVSRSSLEYSLRKYYPEATDEEIEMAINGDDDAFGESTEPERTFDARTFSQMAWLGESSETLEYSTPYVDGETAPENTVDDEDAIRSLMSAWNRIADRFAERMRQHGYSPQLADAIVTAAAGRFYKSIESGI